jgi:hypothetical protein
MPEVRSKETVVRQWYTDGPQQHVSRAGDAAIKQLDDAMADAPTDASDVDAWFELHFHQAPISIDTALYNALHAAKEELKKLLAGE